MQTTLDYDGMVEDWKVELVVSRARRMGFREDELEDVQQEVVLDVARFRYNASRSNGATEKTALTALIDNRLNTLMRTERRYQSHVEQCASERRESYDPHPQADRIIDTASAVASLLPAERRVCQLLSEGASRHAIARTLGCGWHTVNGMVREIREKFKALGLDASVLN